MPFAFEELAPSRTDQRELSYKGPVEPVLERVLGGGGAFTSLDCTRILMGLMEYRRARPASTVTPALLGTATMQVKQFLTTGNEEDLAGLRTTVAGIPTLGAVVLDQTGLSCLGTALLRQNCEKAAHDMRRRVGDHDTTMIALGGSGILPGIQTAICRDATDGTTTTVYPLRYSRQRLNDARPVVTDDETDYLKQATDGNPVVVFDETVATTRTMTRALSFVAQELGRPDASPVWCHDTYRFGRPTWPFPGQRA
jgi:hypothetical protein